MLDLVCIAVLAAETTVVTRDHACQSGHKPAHTQKDDEPGVILCSGGVANDKERGDGCGEQHGEEFPPLGADGVFHLLV